MEILQESLLNLFVTIGCGLLSLAGAYFLLYLSKAKQKLEVEIASIKSEDERLILDTALNTTYNLIKTNVVKAEETIVKGIKESTIDGKIDRKELEAVAIKVKEDVIVQMGKDTYGILNNTLGDVDNYIEASIEKALAEIKGQVK